MIGFVNEGKLTVMGEGLDGQDARLGLLRKWLAKGFELGNHTYSHQSLNEIPIEEFEADVVRGEPATAALLGSHGRKLRYFRHPFLQVGLDLEQATRLRGLARRAGLHGGARHHRQRRLHLRRGLRERAQGGGGGAGPTDRARPISNTWTRSSISTRAWPRRCSAGRSATSFSFTRTSSTRTTRGSSSSACARGSYRFVPLSWALEDPAYRFARRLCRSLRDFLDASLGAGHGPAANRRP